MSNWRKTISLILIGLGLMVSCDTKNSVKPRNENFFFKVYGGVTAGEQVAARIIETTDGGLLAIGTSYNTDGTEEIILIKTDVAGNSDWIVGTSSIFGPGIKSEGIAILEISTGYVLGGIIDDGTVFRSVLLRVDQNGLFSGNPTDSVQIWTNYNGTSYSNWLGDITLGPSGLLVSGYTDRPYDTGSGDIGGKNGYIGLYGEDLIEDPDIPFPINFFGLEGDEIIAGAFEVKDPNKIGGQNTQYLAFGSTTSLPDLNSPENFFYHGFDDNLADSPGLIKETTIDNIGNQRCLRVKELNDNFWMIGNSDNQEIFTVAWKYSPAVVDWFPFQAGVIGLTDESEIGKSVHPLSNNGELIVAGDMLVTSDHSEILLAKVDGARNKREGWPISFGNSTSTYSSADVTVLSDGSIVTLGTADLEPVRKIVIVKTGPNGEMSF